MKIYVTLLFLLHQLYAQTMYQELLTLIHTESEQMLAKENNNSFSSDTHAFTTLYANYKTSYDINDAFYLLGAAKINYVLDEHNYNSPNYLRSKLTASDINRALISEASINYDDGFFALNIGRNEIDYNWLSGSMDGAIAMIGHDDDTSLRLFFLENFFQLQYNYYADLYAINNTQGLYGALFTFKQEALQVTLFDYYLHNLRMLLATQLSYTKNSYALNASYTHSQSFQSTLYDNESFFNTSVELLFYPHYFEMGGSISGKNGLVAMLQLGNFMFGQFYLSNQVDRENAKNGFVRYMYLKKAWRFETLWGVTHYDNSYETDAPNLHSQEVDIYLSYQFNKHVALDFGCMAMQVDERDPIQTSQFLIMGNMVYQYESF